MHSIIQSTPVKLKIAGILYKLTKLFFRENKRIIQRRNIKFEIDLREGIDLSLFLFGSFQDHIYNSAYINIPKDGIIFDVGANVGIMSHFFAIKVPDGKVHAFEPTHYALNKFKRNMDLNPELKRCIELNNCFVSSESVELSDMTAYSSWRIDGQEVLEEKKHEVHGGTAKDTAGISSISIDNYCKRYNIQRVSLLKIDTDGYELEVLKGAKVTLLKFRPPIIFELCNYLLEERNIAFEEYIEFFNSINYKIYNANKSKELTLSNYKKILPKNGGIDALAFPL